MSPFTVVDLGSQAHAVARHVQGWNRGKIIHWLRQSGTIRIISTHNGGDIYLFRSSTGIETGFFFDEQERLIILGDHTTFVADPTRAGKEENDESTRPT